MTQRRRPVQPGRPERGRDHRRRGRRGQQSQSVRRAPVMPQVNKPIPAAEHLRPPVDLYHPLPGSLIYDHPDTTRTRAPRMSTSTDGTNKIPATLIPGRRHRARDRGCRHPSARCAGRPVRVGPPAGRPRRHRGRRRPAAASHAGQHPPQQARPERPPDHTRRRRLPLRQRPPAGGISALRQSASRPHAGPGRPLREHRPDPGAREPGRPLRRVRALHPDRRRSARGGDLLRREHPRRVPPHRALRLRACGQARPQEGHPGAQGQRAEGADRRLPGSRRRRSPRNTRAASTATSGSSMPARCSLCSTPGSST